jgi:CBS-domain-containing membrane protein
MANKITMADIMTPIDQYIHVPFWHSIRQAMAALEKGQKKTEWSSTNRVVLVFDNAYNLVGAVRRLNLLRGLEPNFLHREAKEQQKSWFPVKDDVSLSVVDEEKIEQHIKSRSESPIKEVMESIDEVLSVNDQITKAVFDMAKVPVGVIPILDEKSVVGIVTIDELFKAVTKIVVES